MVYLEQYQPAKLIRSFPLRAILLPVVTGRRETSLAPGSAVEAMHAIAQTCLLHLPYHREAILRKVGNLSRAVPVYRLLAGTDLAEIPRRILELLRCTA